MKSGYIDVWHAAVTPCSWWFSLSDFTTDLDFTLRLRHASTFCECTTESDNTAVPGSITWRWTLATFGLLPPFATDQPCTKSYYALDSDSAYITATSGPLITDIAGGAVWRDLHMICDVLHHRTTARRCGAVLIRSGPGDGLHQVSRQTHLMELSDLERWPRASSPPSVNTAGTDRRATKLGQTANPGTGGEWRSPDTSRGWGSWWSNNRKTASVEVTLQYSVVRVV